MGPIYLPSTTNLFHNLNDARSKPLGIRRASQRTVSISVLIKITPRSTCLSTMDLCIGANENYQDSCVSCNRGQDGLTLQLGEERKRDCKKNGRHAYSKQGSKLILV